MQREWIIASIALAGILLHLRLAYIFPLAPIFGIKAAWLPLWAVLVAGLPLVADLAFHLAKGAFNSDLLAGISIITSVILVEYLA